MKHWMRTGIYLVLFSLLAGCDDSPADSSLTVTQAQNGQTVFLAKGGTLTVELAGNPTTGYEWTVVQIDATFLRDLGSTYASDSSSIGAGGTYTFRFEALKTGTTLLKLTYRRSWEPAAIETFSLTVIIHETENAMVLNGTAWRLMGWSASSLNPADFNITASFSAGQISGTSAVNTYGGAYSATPGGSFSVGTLQTTLMAGGEPAMRAERLYLDLLAQARRYRIDSSQLVLANATGQDLLIYNAP